VNAVCLVVFSFLFLIVTGLMGGSRILQAIARDKVFPFIGWAGRGFGSGEREREREREREF
jgi:amino acid transporter